jgi:hypothetical protein
MVRQQCAYNSAGAIFACGWDVDLSAGGSIAAGEKPTILLLLSLLFVITSLFPYFSSSSGTWGGDNKGNRNI